MYHSQEKKLTISDNTNMFENQIIHDFLTNEVTFNFIEYYYSRSSGGPTE